MPTTIITKYGSGAPTTSDVVQGELAVDTTNKRLYTQDGSSVIELGTNPAANVTFGDSVKAIFGADSDLQIYHDGSHSYVSDQGTGNLRILAQNFTVRNPANDESMIIATPDAGVTLYYDNSSKFATTSTGVDVTGTVTADGLTVGATSAPTISIEDSDGGFTASSFSATNGGRDLTIKAPQEVVIQDADTGNNWLRIDEGDISFYEDTGTTAKLFWDASAESLGIGTTTPAQPIEILKTSAGAVVPMLQLRNGDATAGSGTTIKFMHSTVSNATAGTSEITAIRTSGNYGALAFSTSGNTAVVDEVMRITDSGVGIGTTSPSAKLDIFDSGAGNANSAAIELTNYDYGVGETGQSVSIESLVRNDGGGTSTTGKIVFGKDSDYSSAANRDGNIQFYTNQSNSVTEAMRIDSSGNVITGSTTANNADAVTLRQDGTVHANNLQVSNAGGSVGGTTPSIYSPASSTLAISTGSTERMRIDSSGNLLVGTSTTTAGNAGLVYFNGSSLRVTRSANEPLNLDRLGSGGTENGSLIDLKSNGTTVGSITANSGSGGFLGIKAGGSNELLLPLNSTPPRIQPSVDDSFDIGTASARFDDIYATNGTIQTSDRNEKQDIEALSEAEQRVAVAAKGLLRKFRWISSVEENGDDARIHFGIIAQDLQAAFEAEGLDAGRYAMFINSTWTDEETGEERSRMGVRYSELLAFIIAAI